MSTATKLAGAQSGLDTDAEFRTDMLAIHNALIATGGLVQTSDTGQTDFTANTRAAGGYTVYRFNDASQSSYPLFIKINWVPTGTTRPGITVDVGTGSNGSGTITGVIASNILCSSSNAGTTTETADNYVSVGDGFLYILFNMRAGVSPNNRAAIFMLERSTDEAGVVHPEEGVTTFTTVNNTRSYAIFPTGFASQGPAPSGSPFNHFWNSGMWDDQVSADVGMMPVPYMMRTKMRYHRLIGMKPGRVSYGVSFDAAHLGSTRKFMAMENSFPWDSTSGWANGGMSISPAFAIPWV